MTIAFWVILGIVGYLKIGYWWGHLSWKAWGKKRRSFTGLICFPISYKKDQIGTTYTNDSISIYPPIVEFYKNNQAYDYAKGIALLWPLKALFNLCTLPYLALEYFFSLLFNVSVKIISKTVDAVISPSRLLPKKPEQPPIAKALRKKP